MARIRLAMNRPMPVTAFWMKLDAAKNTPSERRPVCTWLSSTTSAIIEVPRIAAATASDRDT